MKLYPLVLLAALVACSDRPTPPTSAQSSKAKRAQVADAAIAKTPTPRVYQINGNDLLVVEIPLKDPYSGGLDVQTCFVWRDATYRTATITCPQSPDPATDTYTTGAEPDSPEF